MISTCKQQHRVTFSRCKRVWTGLFSTRTLWYGQIAYKFCGQEYLDTLYINIKDMCLF